MKIEKNSPKDLFEKRILLVTGKGGVGKTVVTAALARMASAMGKRVLALDTERDLHSPSHLLKMLGGPSRFEKDLPYELTSTLSCARLSAEAGHNKFLDEHVPFRWLAKAAKSSKYLQSFLRATPGLQEMGLIYRMLPYLRAKDQRGRNTYELLVVDLPATGHALALTTMPGPMLSVFSSGPMAKGIREAQGYFNDPKQTSAVAVTLPEPLVVSETFELIDGIIGSDLDLGGLFINAIPENPWTPEENESLKPYLPELPQTIGGVWSYHRVQRGKQAKADIIEKAGKLDIPLPLFYIHEYPPGPSQQHMALVLEDLWKGAKPK